jgi:class 3 adenylate cyclase/tetratricopeptide (TPR) repeat protein
LAYPDERRLVSLLFAELTGPLGTGSRLGPEDLRELVGGALAEVVSHIEAFGGAVTSVSGSGLVALFGAPEAHEDDPERALRAALGAVGGRYPEGLSVRAGVETGEAVVGPLLGGKGGHYGAVGGVVGVAAALQSVAGPASVLVGPATRNATEGIFEWGPTEEVTTVSGTKPVVGTYLDKPKARPTGQTGRRALARNAPLAGRGAELSALHDSLRAVIAGHGTVALIAGEPGLGKTRLVSECRKLFMAWAAAGSGRLPLWLEGRAASYTSSVPYGLYRQLLAAWVGVVPEEGEDALRSALDRATNAVFGKAAHADVVGLLGRLMGVPPRGQGDAGLRLSPEQLQHVTFRAVRSLVSKLVSYGPTVLVLEDLHWADPTSLHLTQEVASLAREGPLLLLLTRRPEPDAGVTALEDALGGALGGWFCQLELAPLAEPAARELTRSLLGEGSSDQVIEAISEGAEGNPLFLEERFASLLETGALSRGKKGWQVDHGRSGEIAEALERLVRARVDRLPPGPRKAIVAASVLGPEFGFRALDAVTDLEGALMAAVSELVSGGLLVQLASAPEAVYRFRHGLIQEATYQGLVRSERRRLHARAAWDLEETAAGRLEEVAASLGHHLAIAGELGRAFHYLEMAGDYAARVFANDEAISSYRYALDLAGNESGPSAALAAGAWVKLGELYRRLGRYEDARGAFESALKLVPCGRLSLEG